MIFDLEDYKKRLQAAGVAADLIAEIDTGVKPGFMRQDDYSRKQQTVQQQEANNQAQYARMLEYENSIIAVEQATGVAREQWPETFVAQFNRQNQNPNPNVGAGMSAADIERIAAAAVEKREAALRQEFNTQLEAVGQGSAIFAEFYAEARDDWRGTFGENFPKDDFKKFYVDNGHTNPRVALQLFQQPYIEKKKESEWEKKLEAARLEGEVRGRSQSSVPETSSTSAGTWFGNVTAAAAATSAGAAADATTDVSDLPFEQRHAIFKQRMDKVSAGTPTGASATTQ